MKTFEEFESALMKGESVVALNGFLIVHFYSAMRDDVCGLITACVETCVPLAGEIGEYHRSSSICSSMEAYQVYESVISSFIKA